MTEAQVIRHCAPTLACLKTGSLFCCAFESREALYQSVRDYNRRLMPKGLRMLPLRYRQGKGLIYIYRPERLQSDLRDQTACELLSDCGYPCGDANRCIRHLMERLAQEEEFPHEIGLFLSYPPKDVDGFIHHKGEAKCTGCWKVYDDVAAAQATFARYRKCTDLYWRLWCNGKSIEQLAVQSHGAVA